MTIGSLILRFRQKFGRGLRVAWHRDTVRPRILRTPPVKGTDDKTAEIHVLTSDGDWLNLIWVLKSFYAASGRRYALCIHDDGTLKEEQFKTLAAHFPAARMISKKDADVVVFPALAPYPRCLHFRQTNQLAPKVFDFAHFLQSERMLLLDSDVLFYEEPKELLRRVEDKSYTKNTVNADVASAYTVTPDVARQYLKTNLIERFNSGLGLIHQSSIRLDWIEEFLAAPGIVDGHFWRIEQTLYALCSSRFGVELLPKEYDVYLAAGLNGVPSRHYVGAIRHLMYGEGIRHLKRYRNGCS
jgi:hypothetical protein